jgi:hypothetical protein
MQNHPKPDSKLILRPGPCNQPLSIEETYPLRPHHDTQQAVWKIPKLEIGQRSKIHTVYGSGISL